MRGYTYQQHDVFCAMSSFPRFKATGIQLNQKSPTLGRSGHFSNILLPETVGAFFIASERSDRSSPVCLSFFYSSERFVPRFLMTG